MPGAGVPCPMTGKRLAVQVPRGKEVAVLLNRPLCPGIYLCGTRAAYRQTQQPMEAE